TRSLQAESDVVRPGGAQPPRVERARAAWSNDPGGNPCPIGPPPSESVQLESARARTAIEHKVLPGDVTALGAADEGAHLTELGSGAGAPGRVLGLALPGVVLDRSAGGLRDGRDGGPEPVGVEGPGQEVVDRDVVRDGLAREPRDEAREPGAGAVGEPEDADRRLHRDRGDVA